MSKGNACIDLLHENKEIIVVYLSAIVLFLHEKYVRFEEQADSRWQS